MTHGYKVKSNWKESARTRLPRLTSGDAIPHCSRKSPRPRPPPSPSSGKRTVTLPSRYRDRCPNPTLSCTPHLPMASSQGTRSYLREKPCVHAALVRACVCVCVYVHVHVCWGQGLWGSMWVFSHSRTLEPESCSSHLKHPISSCYESWKKYRNGSIERHGKGCLGASP